MRETINKNYIELYFDPIKMGVKRDITNEKFKTGDIFSLQGAECDGFDMPQKEYQIIKKINEVDGINLDGVVVKQISGEQSTIFSLTKLDCKNLGIEFQPSLQLFPSNMNWKKKHNSSIYDFKPFSKHDFSTYPLMKESGRIEKFVVVISDVKMINRQGLFGIGNVANVNVCNMQSITLEVKEEYIHLFSQKCFCGKNITSQINGHGLPMVSCNNKAFYEVNIHGGINPKDIDGLSIHDIFIFRVWTENEIMSTPSINNRKKYVNNRYQFINTTNDYDEIINTIGEMVMRYKRPYGF